MDNQTSPRSRGSIRISTSELRRRAVQSNEESLLPPPQRAPPGELPPPLVERPPPPPPVELPPRVAKCLELPPPQYKHNARGTPPRHTSDHKAPHVPPVENGSEAQNQSKVKDEPTPTPTLAQLRLCCPCPSRRYLISLRTTITTTIPTIDPPPLPPALPLTTTITIPIPAPPTPPPPTTTTPPAPPTPPPPTTITITTPALHSPFIPGLEAQNQSEGKGESRLQQSAQAQSNEETTEWALLITSVLLEAMSAVFDQVGHALTGMVIAFLALFLSSLDLICKARKEGGNWSQPFGGLLEYFGLAAAVWQCFYSTMEYLYTRKNQQNPIKMSLLPFIFALCVLIFRIIKCRT